MKRLYFSRINVIFSVRELYDLILIVTNSTIVQANTIFHGFDETSLNVTGSGGFDSRINQTDTTTLSMKEQLVWVQTTNERRRDETTCR